MQDSLWSRIDVAVRTISMIALLAAVTACDNFFTNPATTSSSATTTSGTNSTGTTSSNNTTGLGVTTTAGTGTGSTGTTTTGIGTTGTTATGTTGTTTNTGTTTTGTTGTTTTGTTGTTGTGTAGIMSSTTQKRIGSTSSATIQGRIVDASTGNPINGRVTVELEAPTGNAFTKVAETSADANGGFRFANLNPATSYALAITADSNQHAFAPVIVIGGASTSGTASLSSPLPLTSTSLNIALPVAESGTATVEQTITSQNTVGQSAAVSASLQLRASVDGQSFEIPLSAKSEASVMTSSAGDCASDSDCGTAELSIPAAIPQFAVFSGAPLQFAPVSSPPILQVSTAQPQSATATCTPSTVDNALPALNTGTVTAGAIDFHGCDY